jgi:hypothetical protein
MLGDSSVASKMIERGTWHERSIVSLPKKRGEDSG